MLRPVVVRFGGERSAPGHADPVPLPSAAAHTFRVRPQPHGTSQAGTIPPAARTAAGISLPARYSCRAGIGTSELLPTWLVMGGQTGAASEPGWLMTDRLARALAPLHASSASRREVGTEARSQERANSSYYSVRAEPAGEHPRRPCQVAPVEIKRLPDRVSAGSWQDGIYQRKRAWTCTTRAGLVPVSVVTS